MTNSNIIVSAMHLQKASELLKYLYPELSLTLLKIAKQVIEDSDASEEDIRKVQDISQEISND